MNDSELNSIRKTHSKDKVLSSNNKDLKKEKFSHQNVGEEGGALEEKQSL